MTEKPYMIKVATYDVFLPDADGDISIEFNTEKERIYLSKEDVLKLLERFD